MANTRHPIERSTYLQDWWRTESRNTCAAKPSPSAATLNSPVPVQTERRDLPTPERGQLHAKALIHANQLELNFGGRGNRAKGRKGK